ncbi:glucose inhibited division protein a homologue, putative [Plasmodium ovale]|uniref:Glucose inhibited division protein a homologue, putative n=1 Tax=Plasmodium ovale TaxID=36330 RepID=A0A1C3L5W8_PLAOA|nr:glucose inhibited division protein a homologue, putative [Plasmodium ovale]
MIIKNVGNLKNAKIIFYLTLFLFQLILPCYTYRFSGVSCFPRPNRSRSRKNGGRHSKCPKHMRLFFNEKCSCMEFGKTFDVIVIGGGHSGCEASHISAKMNAKTLLITQSKSSIGEMSCNPSIGGIGKGILVKEIDALGGLMGKVIDKSGIHFKILNIKKGLAVRGHRAQADRDLYNHYMKVYMFSTPNLFILENTVQSLLIEGSNHEGGSRHSGNHESDSCACDQSSDRATGGGGRQKRVRGVRNICSCEFYADNVILTTGTFLGGVCHIGKEKYYGGRIKRMSTMFKKWKSLQGKDNTNSVVEPSSMNFDEHADISPHVKSKSECDKMCDISHIRNVTGLRTNSEMSFNSLVEKSTESIASQLRENHFDINRMKTGTPPRLHRNSINFEILEKEDTEKKYAFYFSFLNSNKTNNNKTLPCYKTYTNVKTHELVRKNLNELPDFDCYDKLGNGPRYCPSIAKKVTKFKEKKKHIIWLEPEGYDDLLIYPNGLSSAFPLHIQKEIIHSIEGLEEAHIVFPAYDVEYYYVNPQCLNYTLETKNVKGLFFSGQICGTTGYEEAACQGIVAGINAAINALNKNRTDKKPFILKRSDSYIGVLIHDLINKGITEPYRMLTSRAEYRLYLRPDNCDIRLTPKADKLGIVSKERMYILKRKYASVNRLIFVFTKTFIDNTEMDKIERDIQTGVEGIEDIEREKKNKRAGQSNSVTYNAKGQSLFHVDNSKFEINNHKRGINTLYNTLRSGIEYPLDVLLHKLKDVQHLDEFKDALSHENNCLSIYSYTHDYDMSFLNYKDTLINFATLETACAEVKYASYVKKQIAEINKIRGGFDLPIPLGVKYDRETFPYLSNEEIEKLTKFKPRTLREANKIEGVTMSAIYYLYYYIKNEKNKVKK